MDFLADVWVTCPVCEGRRFNRETLQVRFKGKSIHDVLEMDVQEALEHFDQRAARSAPCCKRCTTSASITSSSASRRPTLSGGEAQRIKLARELCRRSTGKTLYILDEPTTGLHFDDIQKLLQVLHGFVDAGNTVVVIEHNLDVIKTADWLIDLGPEGGSGGGEVVVRRHAGRGGGVRAFVHRPGAAAGPATAAKRHGVATRGAKRRKRKAQPTNGRITHLTVAGRPAAQPEEHRRSSCRASR